MSETEYIEVDGRTKLAIRFAQGLPNEQQALIMGGSLEKAKGVGQHAT